MPLYRSPAIDAIKLRKANSYSYWGRRDSRNRVEPIADPHCAFDLRLDEGDAIFTIGSCFARNVEAKLANAGFRLPMRELLSRPEFAATDARVLNNFSTPSIWNELDWAVGGSAFDFDTGLAQAGDDQWVDLHVVSNVRPVSRDLVIERRQSITRAYRSFADCRLIILTLGLAEVWFDREANRYLNVIPPPPVIRRFPERFELHVLSHAELLDYCERACRLLREHGRGDATILVTVSPVALTATHRPEDVMTANCYSKSVLRAVAEELSLREPGVAYFPTYESVTLSDRQLAWEDDLTHVSELLIRHNVDRLVQILAQPQAGASDGLADVIADVAVGGAACALRHAIDARKGSVEDAASFFAQFEEWVERSPAFATEYVEWLVDQRQAEDAIRVAESVGSRTDRMMLATARALLLARRYADAKAMLHSPQFDGSRSSRYWSLRVQAEGKTGDLAALESSLVRWQEALPKNRVVALVHVARALLKQSSVVRAAELLDLALVDHPSFPLAGLLAAEARLALGDPAGARGFLERVEPRNDSETRQLTKLMMRLAEGEKAAA